MTDTRTSDDEGRAGTDTRLDIDSAFHDDDGNLQPDPTRTSEALSDVDWLRKIAVTLSDGGSVTLYMAEAMIRVAAIADSLEAKDRAYADLSHLCANYKAESERLTKNFADLKTAYQTDMSMLTAYAECTVELQAEIDPLQSRIRQLEAFLRDAVCPVNGCDNNGSIAVGGRHDAVIQEQCQWCDERAKALAVPQEGNK